MKQTSPSTTKPETAAVIPINKYLIDCNTRGSRDQVVIYVKERNESRILLSV